MINFADEENFAEALNFYYYANKDKNNLITPELEEIFKLLEENTLEDLIRKSNNIMSNFFVICKALLKFYQKFNTLPVVGNIPDMTSDTENYILLKKIYEKKGKEDREVLTKMVIDEVKSITDESLSLKKEQMLSTLISEEINYIDTLSKNWPQIHLINFGTINEEIAGCHFQSNDFDEEHHKVNFIWYLLIKSADLFYTLYNRYPGSEDDFISDVIKMKDSLLKYLEENSLKDKINFNLFENEKAIEDLIFEFCRMGNSKIPTSVSIISSIASQEIIKLLTYQFKSVNNTVIYDGINSTLSVFKL